MFPKRREVDVTQPWQGRMTPFRIIGGVYFVGTYQASSHLIDTGDGLILIDTGYANGLYLVLDSIRRLGFRLEDIRYVVHSHYHYDHAEATTYLMPLLSNAKTVIGVRDDKEALREGYFDADLVVHDGDTLSLGNITMRFMETPGHTVGTTSFLFDVEEAGKTYRVGMFGGAGRNTLTTEHMKTYPTCRMDYRNSLNRLRRERVDVMLGNHVWDNDTEEKGNAFLADPSHNPFIDGELFYKFLDAKERKLDDLIARDPG